MRVVKESVATAREKERRKRLPGPLRVAGFCLPKALQPVLPIYLQGVLQVYLSFIRPQKTSGLRVLGTICGGTCSEPSAAPRHGQC